MANLQRIQERIDILPSLIKEVEELHPIAIDSPAMMEPSFDAEEVQGLKNKSSQSIILSFALPRAEPSVSKTLRGGTCKSSLVS